MNWLTRLLRRPRAPSAGDGLKGDAARDDADMLRAHYGAIVDSSDDAIISKTLTGVITSWNRGAERLFGYTAAEAIGQPMLMLIPEGRQDEETGILESIARGESVDHFETVRMTKSGVPVDVSVSISMIRNARGDIVGASKIARDITRRRRHEQKLRTQLAQLELLGTITRAIAEHRDLGGILEIVLASLETSLPVDFACALLLEPDGARMRVARLGAKSEPLVEAVGLHDDDGIDIEQNGLTRCLGGFLVHEPDVAGATAPFMRRFAHGGLRSLVLAPLVNESKVAGVLAVARRAESSFSSDECEFLRQLGDHVALAVAKAGTYAELQRAYEELRDTQQAAVQQERLRALGQMASGIAHDINNALTPVVLYLDTLLAGEPGLTGRGRGSLEVIQRAIDDVASTVARMGEFYRQRDADAPLAPIDMNRTIEQVRDLTRARWSDMAQARGAVVAMRLQCAPDLPPIMGVEGEIREALTNLVFNAVDAMPEGGALTINTGTTAGGSGVYVEVHDTGVGMDEGTRQRCLEPFFTTKGERGSGLGLAMVYGIVKRHSADIDVVSTPGAGTSVRLTFPRLLADGLCPETETAPAALLPPMNILVVDDDPILLRALCDILEMDGHSVTPANGGRAALDTFAAVLGRGESFDAVITDLGMPGVDGRRVAADIKLQSPRTHVILLTGWGQRLIADDDIPAGVDTVLSKPARVSALRGALAAHRSMA
jgi:PAS domain S-box-containing protein